MPLEKSASREAIGNNIREMQAAGHPHAQAVAAALHTADLARQHRAFGGMNTLANMHPISDMSIRRPHALMKPPALHAHLADGGFYLNSYTPWYERNEARELSNDAYHGAGLFQGSGAGRTDRLPRAVGVDSFVMPADVVSGMGEGNTLAGSKIMDAILASGGPYGTPRPQSRPISPLASGGTAGDGKSHVMVASGEYLFPREGLMNIGYRRRAAGKRNIRPDPKADLAEGHKWAREFVDKVRGHVKRFLHSAPKPKK